MQLMINEPLLALENGKKKKKKTTTTKTFRINKLDRLIMNIHNNNNNDKEEDGDMSNNPNSKPISKPKNNNQDAENPENRYSSSYNNLTASYSAPSTVRKIDRLEYNKNAIMMNGKYIAADDPRLTREYYNYYHNNNNPRLPKPLVNWQQSYFNNDNNDSYQLPPKHTNQQQQIYNDNNNNNIDDLVSLRDRGGLGYNLNKTNLSPLNSYNTIDKKVISPSFHTRSSSNYSSASDDTTDSFNKSVWTESSTENSYNSWLSSPSIESRQVTLSPASSTSSVTYNNYTQLRRNSNNNNNNNNNNNLDLIKVPTQPFSYNIFGKYIKQMLDISVLDINNYFIDPPTLSKMALDQAGSRYLQGRIENGTKQEILIIWNGIRESCRIIGSNVFGNYILQKIIDQGNDDIRLEIGNYLERSCIFLSQHVAGCRVIQKIFDKCNTETISIISKQIHNAIISLSKNQNGNHVIQKYLELGDDFYISQSMKILLQNAIELCYHPYSCHVIQKLLYLKKYKTINTNLYNILISNVNQLVYDRFGNYVVQSILDVGNIYYITAVINNLKYDFINISCNKYGSNVAEKCILKASSNDKNTNLLNNIIDQILLNNNENFLKIVGNPYGNYVIQKILKILKNPNETHPLIKKILNNIDQLIMLEHAKHIIKKTEQILNRSLTSSINHSNLNNNNPVNVLLDHHHQKKIKLIIYHLKNHLVYFKIEGFENRRRK